ncbi:MAG: hypothetical protein EP306_00335 [Burkholderiales bacterium]|nr:MAG: hypothetical protein EP306_00335 [Burkholderiales bacterium]
MATPNYGYEKRQRELAKKQKKEEKLRAKNARRQGLESGEEPHGDADAPAEGAAGEGSPGSTPD